MLDKQGYMHARACTRPRVRANASARTHTHEYVIVIAFPRQQWFANAPQCYLIRPLPVCLTLSSRAVSGQFAVPAVCSRRRSFRHPLKKASLNKPTRVMCSVFGFGVVMLLRIRTYGNPGPYFTLKRVFNARYRHNKALSSVLKPWAVSLTCQRVLVCVRVRVSVDTSLRCLRDNEYEERKLTYLYSGESQETQREFKITTFISMCICARGAYVSL